MRRMILAVFASMIVALPVMGARRSGWGASGGHSTGGSGGAHWGGSGASSWSSHGSSGAGSHAGNVSIPASRGLSFSRNSGFTRGIVSHQGMERVPNHYYYHNEGGLRYWHFYDHAGLHWYGFYFGPRFCWFPFWSGYWWWWDVNYARWVWWNDGYWWWYGPGGAVYVDVNDQYIPYDQYSAQEQQQGTDMPAPPTAAPSAPPEAASTNTPASHGGVWKSPDGRRMVQVADGGAYLYDESATPPTLMKTLATKGVENVRFSGGKDGAPMQILLENKDGGFTLLDAQGNPAGKK